jgi:hypothetical protein
MTAKREPEKVWKAVVQEAADDEAEFQRAAGATPAEVDASLAAKELDPKAERAAAGDWRREIEQRVALRKARDAEQRATTRSQRPKARSRPVVLLIAATLGAVVGGGLVYAMTHATPPEPLPAPAPPPPPPEPPPVDSVIADPLVAAAAFRQNAFAECDARQWDTCLAYLDKALALDPAGDEAPPVKKARDKAIKGIIISTRKP